MKIPKIRKFDSEQNRHSISINMEPSLRDLQNQPSTLAPIDFPETRAIPTFYIIIAIIVLLLVMRFGGKCYCFLRKRKQKKNQEKTIKKLIEQNMAMSQVIKVDAEN